MDNRRSAIGIFGSATGLTVIIMPILFLLVAVFFGVQQYNRNVTIDRYCQSFQFILPTYATFLNDVDDVIAERVDPKSFRSNVLASIELSAPRGIWILASDLDNAIKDGDNSKLKDLRDSFVEQVNEMNLCTIR